MTTTKTNSGAPDPEKRVFTVSELLTNYSVSRTRAYAEIKAGRLVARRLGGRTFIARGDADAWVAALPRLIVMPAGGAAR